MNQLIHDPQTRKTAALLSCYGFDLGGVTPTTILEQWLEIYPIIWIRLAVVEALYQGRYKAVSVEQLLKFWLERGHPLFHFNHEFERLISHKLPKILLQPLKAKDDESASKVSPQPLKTGDEKSASKVPLSFSPLKNLSDSGLQTKEFVPATVLTSIAQEIPSEQADSLLAQEQSLLSPLSPIVERVENTSLDIDALDELDWTESSQSLFSAPANATDEKRTIDQFSPQRSRSPWFDKLKVVLQQEIAQTVT